jgi:putative component of membrane protein insertase Oxa1/YidC/SpoIIIJ protein YidD
MPERLRDGDRKSTLEPRAPLSYGGRVLFVLVLLSQTPQAPLPWSAELAPPLGVELPVTAPAAEARPSYLQTLARGAYSLYRGTLSRAKGANCNFAPSCSRYGHEAIERVGLPLGLVLFGARLMRAHLNFDRFYRFDGDHLVDPLDDTLDWLLGEGGQDRWHSLPRSSWR